MSELRIRPLDPEAAAALLRARLPALRESIAAIKRAKIVRRELLAKEITI